MGSGRRKTENKLIGCKHARRVSFSKRRSGLFKKAGELSTLTGCEIAVLVFSQAGRNYSFGYPCVTSVIQRFHKNQMPFVALSGGSVTSDLNQESDEIHKRLDRAKSRGKKPVEDLGSAGVPSWLGTPVHELSYDQLIQGKEFLNKHMEMIEKRIAQISEIGSSSKIQLEGNVPDLNFDPSEDEI